MSANRLIALLTIFAPIIFLMGLLMGPVFVSPSRLIDLLFAAEPNQQDLLILYNIRLPRVLVAALVGALLACCGAVLQGLFRNPLADPSLIGVTSGASVGATFAIVIGLAWCHSCTQLGLPVVASGSFAGGLLAAIIVYRLSTDANGTSVATMLLTGIAISALAGALNHLFTFFADNDMLRRISLWQMGSLDNAGWGDIATCATVLLLLMIVLPRDNKGLNAMLLGESEARHLGINVEWMKRRLMILTALGVGISVAVAGTVAFIGLVIPHLIRILVGPDHRILIPCSTLAGAMLLVAADAVARVIVAPAELPTGIITALLGAPFFISLLLQQRRLAV